VNLVSRNLVWLLLSQLATWAMTLVVMLVLPGLLGAENLGSLTFAGAYVAFFALAAGLGTSPLLGREIARDYSIVPAYVFNAVVLKLLLATVLGAAAVGLGALLHFSGETMLLVAITALGLYPILLNEIFASTLAGMQRMGKSSAWAVAAIYISNIGAILVVMRGHGVVAVSVVLLLGSALPVIGNWLLLRPVVKGHPRRIDPAIWTHLVRAGVPLMLLTVFNQIYGTLDIPILASIAGATVVGWYALAYRWAAIPLFIATVVVGSHYPEMSIHGREAGPEFARVVNRAVKLVLVASVPAGIGLAVVASDLIDLVYGAEFANSIRPLQILALQIPITAMDTILVTALIAAERLRKYLIVAAAAAVINPIICIMLVHATERSSGNGAIGAAIATALTEVLVMTCAIVLSTPGVMDRATTFWSIRCILASLCIVLVDVFAGDTHLVVQILLGVVVYTAACFALRVVSPHSVRDGVQQLRSMVQRRQGVVEPASTGE
jgi:O-antigen/teichoic acid export membrane protein